MKPEIKKNIFGKYEVKYDCPKCAIRLTSALLEAGDVDQCPHCGTKFRIPGKQQREAYESKLVTDEAAKEAEKSLRAEERRIAAEQKRLQQEERRLQQEEERRSREIIVRRDDDERRRRELTNLLPKPSLHTPTSQNPSFPATAQVRLSIDQRKKTGTEGFFRAFGITSGVMAAIAAVFLGLPLLACGGCLGFALLVAPSEEVRERMRVEQAAKATEQVTTTPQTNPDNRREWMSATYGTTIAYKNGGTWTDTRVGTGELVSEMEFRGKTDDYIELFNLNPNARDLLRLYGDRMECKHPGGWVVIGSGKWKTVPGSIAAQPVQTPVSTGPRMTYASFSRVREGMTYPEVAAIVGPPDEQISSVEIGGMRTAMVGWKVGLMGNANMTFQDGKLVAKAQFGLR